MAFRFSSNIALAFVLLVIAHLGVMTLDPHEGVSARNHLASHDNIAVMACGVSESQSVPVQPSLDPPINNNFLPITWFSSWTTATPADLSWFEPVQVGSQLRAQLQVFLN